MSQKRSVNWALFPLEVVVLAMLSNALISFVMSSAMMIKSQSDPKIRLNNCDKTIAPTVDGTHWERYATKYPCGVFQFHGVLIQSKNKQNLAFFNSSYGILVFVFFSRNLLKSKHCIIFWPSLSQQFHQLWTLLWVFDGKNQLRFYSRLWNSWWINSFHSIRNWIRTKPEKIDKTTLLPNPK